MTAPSPVDRVRAELAIAQEKLTQLADEAAATRAPGRTDRQVAADLGDRLRTVQQSVWRLERALRRMARESGPVG